MKLEDFKKYKKLIESDGLVINDDAAKVYAWMEESGRLDEGFLGAVWRWFKRNFSPTARKLYRLADLYEKQLLSELRAEWSNIKDKTLEAKFLKGSYMKLSRDYEERMDVVSGGDEDYRNLAKMLINKKNLKVKKSLLKELSSQMDPEFVKKQSKKYDHELVINARDITNWHKDIDKKVIADLTSHLQRKINENPKGRDFIKNEDEKAIIIALIIAYTKNLSLTDKNVKLNDENVTKFINHYLRIIDELWRKLESDDVSKDDAIKAIKQALLVLMRNEKPLRAERLREEALKKAKDEIEKQKKSDEDDDEEEEIEEISSKELEDNDITTDNTEEVSDVDIDKSVEDAANNTDKDKPTSDDIIEEINTTVREYFEDNFQQIYRYLVTEVEMFNEKPEEEKNKKKDEFDFDLDSSGNLKRPSENDTKLLLKDFIKIAGKIVPYYLVDNKRRAIRSIVNYLFYIYAIKKDIEGSLSDTAVEQIVKSIQDELNNKPR